MKLHKILILTAFTLSLNGSNNVFAAKKAKTAPATRADKTDSKTKKTPKESAPLSHTIEKVAAIAQLLGASADAWATESQEISKNTKNLIIGLAAASRLASNITTQVINMNEDSSRISLAHTPWIVFDAFELTMLAINSIGSSTKTLPAFIETSLMEENPVNEVISTETYLSFQKMSRQFTALGEGAAVVTASFLRDRVEPVTILGKKLTPTEAREICYTLSSIMRSGNLLLASKPTLEKGLFALSLVAYSALFIYQFSTNKESKIIQERREEVKAEIQREKDYIDKEWEKKYSSKEAIKERTKERKKRIKKSLQELNRKLKCDFPESTIIFNDRMSEDEAKKEILKVLDHKKAALFMEYDTPEYKRHNSLECSWINFSDSAYCK